MRLIGIKTGAGDSLVMKNLQKNTWYPFGKHSIAFLVIPYIKTTFADVIQKYDLWQVLKISRNCMNSTRQKEHSIGKPPIQRKVGCKYSVNRVLPIS